MNQFVTYGKRVYNMYKCDETVYKRKEFVLTSMVSYK